jgi:glutaredoxin
MSDPVARLLVAGGVIAVSLLIAVAASKFTRPLHPSVVVGEVGDRPGVVLFTSTDCTTCKKAIERLKAASVPFREVTHELEPARFESWEVVAVPLTVFVDASDRVVATLTGVPSNRAIRKAARSAGVPTASRS